jgi:hypothetical protein
MYRKAPGLAKRGFEKKRQKYQSLEPFVVSLLKGKSLSYEREGE